MDVRSARGIAPRPTQGQLAKPLIPAHESMLLEAKQTGNGMLPTSEGAVTNSGMISFPLLSEGRSRRRKVRSDDRLTRCPVIR